MKKKNLINLMIAFCFIIMFSTGLLLYFGVKKWHFVETLHILFGLVFLGFAIFHILNNWNSILAYSKGKKEKSKSKEFIIVFCIFLVVLVGGGFEILPFKYLAHGGKILFGPKRDGGQNFDKNNPKDIENMKLILDNYIKSINDVDTVLGAKVFDINNSVKFVHPLGIENSWNDLKENFYIKLMKGVFSKRELKVINYEIKSEKNIGWIYFNWEFKAKFSKDNKDFNSNGMETQILLKTNEGWKITHVQYTSMNNLGF